MNNIITFTPAGLLAFISTVLGIFVAIGTAVTLIYKLFKKLREPEDEQNKRIEAMEHRLDGVEKQNELFVQYFTNDDRRFKNIEVSTKVILGTLHALLKHAINGNDIEQLEDAEKELNKYLIQK